MKAFKLPSIRSLVAKLRTLTLSSGNHHRRETGMCAMEAAAFIAGEPHSDHPDCVCPIITRFMISWNDTLPSNAERDRLLKPLIPKILGTRGSEELARRRSMMALDWFLRIYTPAFLDAAALADEASALRVASIDDRPALTAALNAAKAAAEKKWSAAESAAESAAWSAARSAAWSAARSAAESAAWSAARSAARSAAESAAESAARSAAWSAARSAAWSAAWSAARSAAWSAAWSAARSAARSAAWSAAWSAAEKFFAPLVAELQKSATKLVLDMAALKEAK
jgi:hypothetical protein